jgi:manganese-dependent inorganic pyrophosphatase
MQTIVIGHRNPDMDSICAAIGYARLKTALGAPNVIAGRAGNTNPRIDHVLQKFHAEPPVFFSDVSPHVADVMRRDVVFVHSETSIYDCIHFMEEKRLRGLPVVDEQRRCLGLLSAFKVIHHLFPLREEAFKTRLVHAPLSGIVMSFGGTLLTGQLPGEAAEHLLMVGAMAADSFSERLREHRAEQLVVFVGNRDDIQMRAIEARVRAIVVTGGMPVLSGVLSVARGAGVTVISSPHDTATSVLLSRGAVAAHAMVDATFESFSPDTPLETARVKAAASAAFVFPIVDDEGKLVGVLSKSDFITPVPRNLILVDHNELAQAVPGADKVPIIEILDHHRLGGFSSDLPIHFWNYPVGSSCTIVTLCHEQYGVEISADTAGLLMSGIISDTLNLSSPTATAIDRRVLEKLSTIAGINPARLAEEIFSVGSPLLTLTPRQAVTADCKEYEQGGKRFTVAQIEELSFNRFREKQSELIDALESHRKDKGLYFAALLVTDINTQNSLLLACGDGGFLERITFPSCGPHVWQLDGIVSRKKQLLPYLLQCLSGAPAAPVA